MNTIQINFMERSYPIHIVEDTWDSLCCSIKGKIRGDRILVVCDENVHALYYQPVKTVLESDGYKVYEAVVTPGEVSKSLETAETLYTYALRGGLDRSSAILALGGGVIGDLAGFVAATYMRGIDFIQVPTSLLAQVDSSVGGKVAVNHPLAKNIIGSFYQPRLVYINVSTLATLPPRELATGMAELIKHGFIWDEGLLLWLESYLDKLTLKNIKLLAYGIYRSCQIKAHIVENDEMEKGLRAILNFGHTIGHAIESVTDYSRYTHGEAVSLGMVYESKIAAQMGLVDSDYIKRLSRLLQRAGLPVTISSLNIDSIMEKMAHDKKNIGGNIVFVLPVGIGKVDVFKDVDPSLVRRVLSNPNI